MVVDETLEVIEVPSDDVFENVGGFFFEANPIRSMSLDDEPKLGIEGLRNNPFTEARGFRGLEERVLLPDFIDGVLAVDFPRDGEACCDAVLNAGGGTFDGDVSDGKGELLGIMDSLLVVPVFGRLVGNWVPKLGGGRNVFVEARKSIGADIPGPALEFGLELEERDDGGLIDPSAW